MTWKTPLARALADAIQKRHGIVTHLLRKPEVVEMVLGDESFMVEIFGVDGPWSTLYTEAKNREVLGLDTAAATWVNPELVLEYLTRNQFRSLLETSDSLGLFSVQDAIEIKGANTFISSVPAEQLLEHLTPELMLKHLETERILEYIGVDVMLSHLGPDSMLNYLGVERMLESLGTQTMLEYVGADAMFSYLGPEALLAHLDADVMLEYLGSEAMLAHLGPEVMLVHLGADTMFSYIGADAMFAHLGVDKLLEYLSAEDMLEHLGPKAMLEYLGVDTMLKHLGIERILASVDLKNALDHFGIEKVLAELDVDTVFAAFSVEDVATRIDLPAALIAHPPEAEVLAGYLQDHPEELSKVLKCLKIEPAVNGEPETCNGVDLAKGLENVKRLTFNRPAVIVAYPRTGSNFLQSILTHSSYTHNISIYTPNPKAYEPLLSVKSHAISPEYLQDEMQRLLAQDSMPDRMLLLKRDPRDVMISFYEYTQAKRNTIISQDEFLEDICFFYASTIDKNYTRNVDRTPTSVLSTYKKHIQKWFTDRSASLSVHEMKYEDMVQSPLPTFRAALEYLDLDVPVAESQLTSLVSLYSDEKRSRGTARGWKQSGEKYAVLIQCVESLLAKEIEFLGYNEVNNEPHSIQPKLGSEAKSKSNK